jgi:hypothetical protein
MAFLILGRSLQTAVLLNDVAAIDGRLKGLVRPRMGGRPKLPSHGRISF